jgi:hypothetical protein
MSSEAELATEPFVIPTELTPLAVLFRHSVTSQDPYIELIDVTIHQLTSKCAVPFSQLRYREYHLESWRETGYHDRVSVNFLISPAEYWNNDLKYATVFPNHYS